ncbi:flagellar biosynthesis protein FlhB [Actimicrobium sp. CCC2.4]|uniref:flagellar biosynthesis protein FlhB n=1 Tax=Actimicrobium sp. CCC2.4 TaxID=3048606 RepID=UPI002AC9ECAA|nr:flagellar biosynthesis protein FlhB [Actimicrobium sp. CCC2.4]MEB0135719.1 flagellar biosynthesis protein FlhB [Actimicrobium sp. CCC2.4]WPX33724.1 flagellar biosynthesis protein FlhB [Actimicrobium sp. CCC2.4]
MSDESDMEKTEPASQQRIDKARENGDVPRSRELATCLVLLAAGGGLYISGANMLRQLKAALASGLTFDRGQAFDFSLLLTRLGSHLGDLLLAFAPLAGILILVALASPLLIGGWLFSAQSLAPNFGRMNLFSGLLKIVSLNALVELGKAVAKAVIVGSIAYLVMRSEIDEVLGLMVEPAEAGSMHMAKLLFVTYMLIVMGLVLIAAVDAPYQMWSYAKKMMMTRQEVRQEAKESEGNPEIKAKIRAQQREMARRRMMSEVPTADVVVTNPTHYAVALRYTDGKMGAPQVVAKGADAVAARIRELAVANNVPLLEAPPLARALFKHVELGDAIPETLYTAVAEVLAYVFQLKAYKNQGGDRPEKPKDIDVPAGLDPLEGS